MIKLTVKKYSTNSRVQVIGLLSMYIDTLDKAKEYVENYYPESIGSDRFEVNYQLLVK